MSALMFHVLGDRDADLVVTVQQPASVDHRDYVGPPRQQRSRCSTGAARPTLRIAPRFETTTAAIIEVLSLSDVLLTIQCRGRRRQRPSACLLAIRADLLGRVGDEFATLKRGPEHLQRLGVHPIRIAQLARCSRFEACCECQRVRVVRSEPEGGGARYDVHGRVVQQFGETACVGGWILSRSPLHSPTGDEMVS
jgi:hypothetical protein